LHDWLKCANGEIQYVRHEVRPTFNEKDIQAWDKIHDEYIKLFGVQPVYENYLQKSVELAKVQADYIISSDKYLLNVIRIMEHDIERIKSKMGNGISTEAVLVHLGKWYGKVLDSTKITAKFYFSLLKEYERAN
jgi:ribosome maturation protein Sdo1